MAIFSRRRIGLLVALVVGATAGLLLFGRERAGELTAERLAEARSVWSTMAPDSYTLELEMRGALNEIREIEVRGGRVVGMTAGGVGVSESAWKYWSVEGLFDTLRTELANASEPQKTLGAESIVLLVRFDPTWG